MAMKTANVVARVEPEIKEHAEEILEQIGIPASTAINIFYRQVIQKRGLPFRPSVLPRKPLSREEMTDEEFDARMEESFRQIQNGETELATDAFDRIIRRLRSASYE